MDVYQRLTLAMQRKTDKIQTFKNMIRHWTHVFAVFAAISALLILYVINNSRVYISFVMSYLSINSAFNIKILDIIILILALIFNTLTLFSFIMYQKKKSSYNSLRLDIISSINHGFCNCGNSQSCTCKSDYILYMDTFGIDVIIK